MRSLKQKQHWVHLAAAVVASLAAGSEPCLAHAQEPLDVFLAAGRVRALDAREAALVHEQARAQIDEARARWLPSLSVTGGYTRNEVDVVVTIPDGPSSSTQATLTPLDQADVTLQANLPLIDVGAWLSTSAAEATADASAERLEVARLEADIAIATAYYQVLATRSLRDASLRARDAAAAQVSRARSRRAADLASDLEVDRAETEGARVEQQIADAELQVILAERSLEVLTGRRPGPTPAPPTSDDLTEPRTGSMSRISELPDVRASEAEVRAARVSRDAGWAALAPVVTAFARERITNASGFGPSALWAVGVQASFTLDFLRPAQLGTRERQLELAELRRERAIELARTRVIEADARVRSGIARLRAARAGELSARRARDVATSRLEASLGSQLDVLVAERDLFAAEAARIQAEGDLAVARFVLAARATGSIEGAR